MKAAERYRSSRSWLLLVRFNAAMACLTSEALGSHWQDTEKALLTDGVHRCAELPVAHALAGIVRDW